VREFLFQLSLLLTARNEQHDKPKADGRCGRYQKGHELCHGHAINPLNTRLTRKCRKIHVEIQTMLVDPEEMVRVSSLWPKPATTGANPPIAKMEMAAPLK
jgi:hypothetical protein